MKTMVYECFMNLNYFSTRLARVPDYDYDFAIHMLKLIGEFQRYGRRLTFGYRQ